MLIANYKDLIIPEKLQSPNWEKALAWLKAESWKDLPLGKTEIDGTKLYALHTSYTNKLESECRYESHRLYADIQMPLKGSELHLVCSREKLKIAVPYSEEKDLDFLEGAPDNAHELILSPFLAAVYFPWDVHMPGIALDDKPGEVEKIVLKIAL